MLIPYSIFQWKPPELSLSDRVRLGEKIAKVGRPAFVQALKARLAPPSGRKAEPFTFAEVLADAMTLQVKIEQQPVSPIGILIAVTFFGAAIAIVVQNPRYLAAVIPALGVSLGTLVWVYRKVDRWTQGIIDDYAHAIASGKGVDSFAIEATTGSGSATNSAPKEQTTAVRSQAIPTDEIDLRASLGESDFPWARIKKLADDWIPPTLLAIDILILLAVVLFLLIKQATP
jgi:hypothetical protein